MPYVEDALSRFLGVSPGADGWTALCPCPLHDAGRGDTNPSLRITVGEAGRLLVRCRTGCDTKCVLEAAGLGFADLWPQQGETPAEPLVAGHEEPTEAELDFRNEVYSLLLSKLKLTGDHAANLKARGLGKVAIKANGYRSLLQPNAALAFLERKYGDSLFSIPGFRTDASGRVRLASVAPGILVPCRDAKGRVAAVKLRRDKPLPDGSRYHYLSGGGASCGAVLHHPFMTDDPTDVGYIRVTEGELKADVCVDRTNAFTLGLPGVGLAGRLLPWLASYYGPERPAVRLAFDWPDVVSKPQIAAVVAEQVRLLREAGYPAAVEAWDDHPECKGIDDLLAAGHRPTLLEGAAIDARLAALAPAAPNAAAPRRQQAPWEWKPAAFPADCLPEPFGDFVREVGRVKGAPVDFPGMTLLTIAGAAVGTTRRLLVDQDWHEYPCLFVCVLAPPSRKKSPVLRTFMQPLYDWQGEEQKLADRDATHDTRHYFMSDITVEGAVKQLRKHPRGLLYVKDELVGWVASANQYRQGRGEDRQFWLSIWSSSPYKKDRQNSDSIFVPRPFLSVIGNTTPDQVREFADAKGRQDGFLQRILMVYPAWTERTRLGCPTVDDAAYRALLGRLYALEFDADEGPHTLTLEPDAFRQFSLWYEALQDEVEGPRFPADLVGFWNKLPAYCARLALILRLLETDDPEGLEPVRLRDVERACELVAYLQSHHQGAMNLLHAKDGDHQLRPLCDATIAAGGLLTVRDAMRGLRIRTRSEAVALFRRGQDLGLGELTSHLHAASGRRVEAFRHPAGEA